MKYEKVIKGRFISRPNRFVAVCTIEGRKVEAHVKNTGRCREILIPGADIWLQDHIGHMNGRRLRYSLICVEKTVEKGMKLINIDSQAPNAAVHEALRNGVVTFPGMKGPYMVKTEQRYKDSRFDFYVKDADGKEAYAEVKGVTLENKGVCMFPDAPTERGKKHIIGLADALGNGYLAYIIFVIQMEFDGYFTPNKDTDPGFADALMQAAGRSGRACI